MWFAVHVKPGMESQVVDLLKSTPKSDMLDEVFCPMTECQRKDHGELIDSLKPMIDGIVFVLAPSKRELRACIRQATGLEAMFDGRPAYEAMKSDEEVFINLWAAPENRICGMSEGWVDKAGDLHLEDGPLFERRGDICGFSRNRRFAYMETLVAGKSVRVMAGVRVTRSEQQLP